MQQVLIIGDTHIEEKNLSELEKVFNEILKIKTDILVQGGDLFEKSRPTPREIDFASHFISKWKKQYKKIYVLAGNGTHEYCNDFKITKFLNHFSDTNSEVIPVNDEFDLRINNKLIHLGHYMLHCSILMYGTGRKGIKDLEHYDKVFLFHQHNQQVLKTEKAYHVGSVFYQNFNEVNDKYKQVVVTDGTNDNFIKLTTPIPMVDVTTIKELDQLPERTKVRIIINSFENYKKQVNKLSKYKERFEVFRIKLDFSNTPQKKEKKKGKNTKEIITSFLKKVKDKEVRKELEEQFKQENQL